MTGVVGVSERRIVTVAAGIVVLALLLFTAALTLGVPVWLVGPVAAGLAWWLAGAADRPTPAVVSTRP